MLGLLQTAPWWMTLLLLPVIIASAILRTVIMWLFGVVLFGSALLGLTWAIRRIRRKTQ